MEVFTISPSLKHGEKKVFQMSTHNMISSRNKKNSFPTFLFTTFVVYKKRRQRALALGIDSSFLNFPEYWGSKVGI